MRTMDILKLNLSLIKYNQKIIFYNFFVWLIINCLPLIITLCIRTIFISLQSFNNETHMYWCLSLLVFVLVYSYFICMGGKIDTITRFDIRRSLREKLICKDILNRENLKEESGAVIEILTTDIMTFEELVSVEIDLICKLLFAFISLGVMLSINYKITLLFMVPIFFISSLVFRVTEKIREKHLQSRDSNIQYTELVSNILTNHEVIQLVADTHPVFKRMEKVLKERKRTSIKMDVFNTYINELATAGSVLSIGFVLLFICMNLDNFNMSIGDLTLIISLTAYIGEYNGLFTETYCAFQYVGNTLKRIRNIFSDSKFNIVEFDKVDLFYDAKKKNFQQRIDIDISLGGSRICFSVDKGEIITVTGKTASGKSHLIDALIGYAKYDGDIIIDNQKVDYIHHVAVALQNPSFLNESLEENVLLNKNGSIEGLLHAFGLYGELYKNGDTLSEIGVNGNKLSEGQRQRLSIVRAMMQDSKLLILDDSTSLLDYENEMKIMQLLRKQNYTVIMATSRVNVMRASDRVVVLENQEIIKIGTYDEIVSYLK